MSLGENVRSYGAPYGALLALSSVATVAALLTLVPNPGASWPCVLGYKALCTFTPASTFACALVAAFACTARTRLVKKSAAPLFVPALAIIALVAGLGIFTFLWAGAKDGVDGASAATQLTSGEPRTP